MGLLNGILGGIIGAELANVVGGVIERHGGLAGLAQQFQQQGLGHVMESWIGTGPNAAISPDQVHQALGNDAMTQLAKQFGLNPQDLAGKLAEVLPAAIDKMTPGGAIPGR